ncbi:MAG: helix-turn-helix domain-containing protein [Pseudomonadota bacterium]
MSIKYSTLNRPKKPASKDWHRADIIAAVRKAGSNLHELSRKHGYKAALLNALYYPAPKYERLIAEFLNTTPEKIWPSRYHADGTSKSGRGERGRGRYKAKFNGSITARKVNLTGAH